MRADIGSDAQGGVFDRVFFGNTPFIYNIYIYIIYIVVPNSLLSLWNDVKKYSQPLFETKKALKITVALQRSYIWC